MVMICKSNAGNAQPCRFSGLTDGEAAPIARFCSRQVAARRVVKGVHAKMKGCL
jgi:hypothetical protein